VTIGYSERFTDCRGAAARYGGGSRRLADPTRARPARIRAVLRLLNAGATPAPLALAQRCRAVVTTVSLRAASDHGCLPRSLAVLVACRLAGCTVTWRVGVASPPPSSHAWVEADDTPVGERFDPRLLYSPIITVHPAERITQ
jgi:Transglutaminase-like superfamily